MKEGRKGIWTVKIEIFETEKYQKILFLKMHQFKHTKRKIIF